MYINVAGLDAMRDELLASGLHVGYHDLDPFLGARRHFGDAGAHDDGARRPGRGELHKPQRLVHLVIVIGVETYLIHIEGLGAVNIGHRYRYQFDLPDLCLARYTRAQTLRRPQTAARSSSSAADRVRGQVRGPEQAVASGLIGNGGTHRRPELPGSAEEAFST